MMDTRSIQRSHRPAVSLRRVRTLSVLGGVTALVATLGVLTLAVGPAGAKTPVGTGTFRCSTPAGGEFTFSPAWSDTGTGTVHATVNMTITGCTGGSPTPTSVTVTGKMKFPNGGRSCTLGVRVPGKLKVSYFPMVKKSKLISSNLGFYTDDTLGATFFVAELPFVVTGSYPVTASSGSNAALNAFGYRGTPSLVCKSGLTSVPAQSSYFSEA